MGGDKEDVSICHFTEFAFHAEVFNLKK